MRNPNSSGNGLWWLAGIAGAGYFFLPQIEALIGGSGEVSPTVTAATQTAQAAQQQGLTAAQAAQLAQQAATSAAQAIASAINSLKPTPAPSPAPANPGPSVPASSGGVTYIPISIPQILQAAGQPYAGTSPGFVQDSSGSFVYSPAPAPAPPPSTPSGPPAATTMFSTGGGNNDAPPPTDTAVVQYRVAGLNGIPGVFLLPRMRGARR